MKKLAVALFVGGLVVSVGSAHAQAYPADNSGKNVRDRQDAAITSGDQSNSRSDLKITQEIRQAVVADKDLSANAHNIKIITANGVVTLRGPVKSSAEKSNIGTKAEHVAGVTRIDNQIEIAND